MKVLLIAHAVPPAPSSGAQRAANVARALRTAGLEVRIITSRARGAPAQRGASDPDLIEVEMHASGADLLSWMRRVLGAPARVARRLRGRAGSSSVRDSAALASAPAATGVPAALPPVAAADPLDPGPRVRRWVTAVLRFPNGQLGFLVPAVRAALREAGTIDVIYTTGPPVTTHLIGLTIHGLTGIPWVSEFRDPWILDGAPYRPPSLRCALTDAIERGLSRRCQAVATEMVGVSEGIARLLSHGRVTEGRPPARSVLNGIPATRLVESTPPTSGPLRVLHLGNLYGFRDAGPFLEALSEIHEANGWSPSDIRVDFVGDPPPPPVAAEVRRLSLTDVVHFTGWVPHEAGQTLIRDADILLLLAQRQPLQVPNKLYEYLGSGRLILAFADADGETARMLAQVDGHYTVSEDDRPERTRELVEGALDHGRGWRPTDRGRETLKDWSTERQLAALAGIVARAARSRSRDA